MPTIKEIKKLLAQADQLDSPIFDEFSTDTRAGVVKEIQKRKQAIQAEID